MGGRTVARVERDPADPPGVRTTKVLQSNGLGHLLGVLGYVNDGSGTLSYTLEVGFQFGPFGEILEAGAASGADADDYRQRFNGKGYDTGSGLSYYGYRYYDPVSMTWNRSDPLYRFGPERVWNSPSRGNLYSFSLGNPVRYEDPDGLDVTEGVVEFFADTFSAFRSIFTKANVAQTLRLAVASRPVPQFTTKLGKDGRVKIAVKQNEWLSVAGRTADAYAQEAAAVYVAYDKGDWDSLTTRGTKLLTMPDRGSL